MAVGQNSKRVAAGAGVLAALVLLSGCLTVSNQALPKMYTGHSVRVPLWTTGAAPGAKTWSATGLPAGITLGATTGYLEGTPTVSGSFTVHVTVTDSGGASTQRDYPLSVVAGSTPVQVTNADESITGTVLSGDGHYAAFYSTATNLASGDTTGFNDVFVRNEDTGIVQRITAGNHGSVYPAISSDGQYVAFVSDATDLVAGDTNGFWDVFVWSRATGTTTRITNGNEDSSLRPSISGDGRFVAFGSKASNLDPANSTRGAFLWDRSDGSTKRISDGTGSIITTDVAADGKTVVFDSYGAGPRLNIYRWTAASGVATQLTDGNDHSWGPATSGDGSMIAFYSSASTLVPGDDNFKADVFVWDAATGQLARITHTTDGTLTMSTPRPVDVSANGRYVVFLSRDTMLVPNDPDSGVDLFLWDRPSGATMQLAGGFGSGKPSGSISADGSSFIYERQPSILEPYQLNTLAL